MLSNQMDLITIDKRSTVDYALQLRESLKSLIIDQVFYYHTVLPTVSELADHLSIELKEVEDAYEQLVIEGYLSEDDYNQHYVSFFELTNYFFDRNTAVYDAIKSLGMAPSIVCLVKEVVKLKDEALIKMGFKVEDGHEFFHINRIYKGDQRPIMVLENYLPLSVFPDIFEKFVGTEPLNEFLKKTYGLRAESSNRRIKTVNLTKKQAQLLNEKKNKASIQSTNKIYDRYGRLIDFGVSYSVSSYYFQSLITRDELVDNYPETFE